MSMGAYLHICFLTLAAHSYDVVDFKMPSMPFMKKKAGAAERAGAGKKAGEAPKEAHENARAAEENEIDALRRKVALYRRVIERYRDMIEKAETKTVTELRSL